MVIAAMNDPWDVKSVRQSNQYLSCMKINGVPLLPPVLSKECYLEMQYYKLLAKEVEKRIKTLKPLIVDSDTESSEDKTDAPELPESEQSYDISPEDIQNENKDNITTEKYLEDCNTEKIQHISNTYDNITSNFSIDADSASSKLSSKFVIDLSLSINETGKNLADSINTSDNVDIPERDCDYSKKGEKKILTDVDKNCETADQLSFNLSVNKDPYINLLQDGPSSLNCKSFTGSLNNIHTESVKQTQATDKVPLTRQRSYTVLIPSPMLLAHLEVQSINTGMDITSISMSESMSNISNNNKKRRSWDLETAKVKWSSMALELKEKNITNNNKNTPSKNLPTKSNARKVQPFAAQRPRSLAQEKVKRSPPKMCAKSEVIQRPRIGLSPVRNSIPPSVGKSSFCQKSAQKKKDDETTEQNNISESDDPATRVRELYDKIQKQQLIQMANLVEKQKKEQMLLQQVFEEQNNLLFTQLKSICPKSPNDVIEACNDHNNGIGNRGPVSLSQLINQKQSDTTHSAHNSPVLSTLTDTNNYINYCDSVLKKSRVLTGSMKKPEKIMNDKSQSPQQMGSTTRTYSPSRRNTPTSRKLTYENSASSDRDNENILTDRTNDTMADILNVTFPSDYSDECPPYLYKTVVNNNGSASDSPVSASTVAASCRSTHRPIRSVEQSMQDSNTNNVCGRIIKTSPRRAPTAQERAAATKIVSYAKGYLVRRLMRSERVQATVQTIKDALLCALQLHTERGGIRGADVDLHRRLIQQITAACYSLHDTFIASSPAERCALLAADRSRRRSLAARLPTPTRHRPTDI